MDNWNNFNLNQNPSPMWAQHYEIIRVNGEGGARNFRMAPNSNALLLDTTASIVWLAQTDGTGYLTVTPYDITPHQPTPTVDVNNLAMRVEQLEELINNANFKSNSFTNKQSKKQSKSNPESTDSTD